MSDQREEWAEIYASSAFSLKSLAELAGIDEGAVRAYLAGTRQPRAVNRGKMEQAIRAIGQIQRLTRHPSWGYARPEQIKVLFEHRLGPERDAVLKRVEAQTAARGKYL